MHFQGNYDSSNRGEKEERETELIGRIQILSSNSNLPNIFEFKFYISFQESKILHSNLGINSFGPT